MSIKKNHVVLQYKQQEIVIYVRKNWHSEAFIGPCRISMM